jgi:outer membrane protein insertion porin family
MKRLILLFITILNLMVASAWASNDFVVKKIEINGLQRISSETVYSYLPIKPGEHLHANETSEIIRTLYKTGFFDHISLTRRGNTLVITVIERPTIGQLKITGNSVIPTDKLTTVMKSVDVAEGRVYNRAILDRIKQSLLNQYYQLGRYNARINVEVTPLERNRVLVKIDISEGLVAKIRHINIIGNKTFPEKKLVKQLTISTPGLFTFFTQTDQYSQEKLDASIDSLRNYYMDRGYIKFETKSSQVSITPDRKSVYVTVAIEEGEPYTVKGYTLSGDLILPRDELDKLVKVKPGAVFSRQATVDTEKAISDAYGNKGYIGVTIDLVPAIDDKTKQVFLNFNIKSGKRTYVRHIYFTSNAKTNDEVLRREMQQMEGSVVSTSQLEESKRRLNVLPFVKETEMSVVPVPSKNDQVDVNYKVTENNSAELTGRIGYSQTDRVLFGAGVNQKNFLGTGKTIGLNAETSRVQKYYSFNYVDPYFTQSGISRSVTIAASRFNPSAANLSHSFSTNEYDASDIYSIPIGNEKTATDRVIVGYGYQNTLIRLPNDKSNISSQVQSFVNRNGRHFQQLDLTLGLSRDSRDKAMFPTRGSRQAVNVNLYAPLDSGSLRYYMMNYNAAWYHPINERWILTSRGALGYGNSLDGPSNYPFFRNYYAGGIDSVRGFTGNTLGPRDNTPNHQSTGGNVLADASVGMILPNYIADSIRTTVFLDGGNVYQTYNNRPFGGKPSGPLRFSSGVAVEWLSPMGPIEVSLARPLNEKPGDDPEMFQLSLGANFG